MKEIKKNLKYIATLLQYADKHNSNMAIVNLNQKGKIQLSSKACVHNISPTSSRATIPSYSVAQQVIQADYVL